VIKDIVAWHLKGGIVEPEETTVARQRLDKHVSTAMDMHAKLEELLETVFSMQSVPMLYSKDEQGKLSQLQLRVMRS
jgi:hypothetical protein